jgi:16S rRNA (uracil1498-N3)-methyltransferase
MRPVRFYCETIEPRSILDPVESGHLSRVLRLAAGAAVELFDGKGTLAEGIVEQIQRNQVTVRVTQQTHTPPRLTGRVILAVSYAKGQRFDWLAEKCTELGADHIAAVQFERTVKLGSDKSLERLSKITLSAAKQCGRTFLPKLTGPAKLKPTVESLCGDYPQRTLIYGSPDGKPLSDPANGSEGTDTIIFIGPEGGFTEAELDYFQTLNACPVCINPHVLRVETAAVAFCAILGSLHT